ncbi:MAG: hypothetical protein HPY83_08970 [Anaerolineae bacterium]|nr:hypothetical protein [Anaerolineae bacterium]
MGAGDSVAYREALRQARLLQPDERLRLIEELAALARRDVHADRRRSVLELEGLGQQVWARVVAQDYVDKERDSWTG